MKGGNGNKSGASVSVDQLHSSQTGLVPKFSGKSTIVRIWSVQVMVDHLNVLPLFT